MSSTVMKVQSLCISAVCAKKSNRIRPNLHTFKPYGVWVISSSQKYESSPFSTACHCGVGRLFAGDVDRRPVAQPADGRHQKSIFIYGEQWVGYCRRDLSPVSAAYVAALPQFAGR